MGSWWSVSACSCAAGPRPTTAPPGATPAKAPHDAGRATCRRPPSPSRSPPLPHPPRRPSTPRGAVPASHRRSHRRRIRRRHHGRRRPRPARVAPCCDAAAAPEPRPEPLAESQHLRPQVFGTPGTLLRRRALGRSTLGRPRRRHASLPEPKRRSPSELGRGRRGFTGWGLMSDLLDQGLVSSLGGHRAPAPSLFECRQRRPPEVQSSESGGADVEDREEQGGEPPRQRQR